VSRLLDLAARCQAATGPDQALDEAIERAIGTYSAFSYYTLGDNDQPNYVPTRYTASLDAAMQLVPEGASWQMGRGFSFAWAIVSLPSEDPMTEPREMTAEAATPALALCTAALRARASMESSK
jgi:hypothetical protein